MNDKVKYLKDLTSASDSVESAIRRAKSIDSYLKEYVTPFVAGVDIIQERYDTTDLQKQVNRLVREEIAMLAPQIVSAVRARVNNAHRHLAARRDLLKRLIDLNTESVIVVEDAEAMKGNSIENHLWPSKSS